MYNWKNLTVNIEISIVETMKIIQREGKGIVFVVDQNDKLLGTVTDGDIRRGILNGISLESNIKEVMYTNPLVLFEGERKELVKEEALEKDIRVIPVVTKERVMKSILIVSEISSLTQDTPVVVMAGGLGSRLGQLTEKTPKPMLKVGGQPILETLIKDLRSHGFKKIFISVNYLSHVIEDHFKDGSKYGVSINYIKETKRLGTAGGIALICDELKKYKTFLVVNGDLVTKVSFSSLLEYYVESQCNAIMCVKEYDFQIPYGVVKLQEQGLIDSFDEKPVQKFFVNAGAYVFSSSILELIPHDTYFDMNQLFAEILNSRMKSTVYPLSEYWIDVGQEKDLNQARIDHSEA